MCILTLLRAHSMNEYKNVSSEPLFPNPKSADVRKVAPLAFCVNSSDHCLNIAISKSYTLLSVRNLVDRLQQLSIFLTSSKGMVFFNLLFWKALPTLKDWLIDLSKTHWVERHNACQTFFETSFTLFKLLNLIDTDDTWIKIVTHRLIGTIYSCRNSICY